MSFDMIQMISLSSCLLENQHTLATSIHWATRLAMHRIGLLMGYKYINFDMTQTIIIFISSRVFRLFCFADSAETNAGCDGKFKESFGGHLCQEYLYQKLLKSAHRSTSYD